MSANGENNKDELYKNLSRLASETGDSMVLVENGQAKSVILPYEEYKNLKTGHKQNSRRLKGVILAGGNATRLRPLTWVTNKHLLPIYDRPMIYYPLQAMQQAGVKEVLISTNPQHAGDFMNLLGTGEDFNLQLQYTIQKEPKGMAQVVGLAESFAKGSPVLVLAGDNLFDFDLSPAIERFSQQGGGARIFAMEHPQPQHYGVIEIGPDGKVISIEEKPKEPKSNYIAIGIYLFDSDVFDYIKTLTPSARGEYEIADLIDCYRQRGDLYCEVLGPEDWWVDAGTSYDELFNANLAAVERTKKKAVQADSQDSPAPAVLPEI